MNRPTVVILALLTCGPGIPAQQKIDLPSVPAPLPDMQERALQRLAWQRHLADNSRKVAAGDTGRLTVTLSQTQRPVHARVWVRVAERVPAGVQRGGLVVTHHFVEIGVMTDDEFVARDIPIGLDLIVEVWPEDGSAPIARCEVAGPTKREAVVDVPVLLAAPYPVLTGRVLNAAGDPFASRDVAIEIRSGNSSCQEQVHTDAAGRFSVRYRAGEPRPGEIVLTPGKLIRSGGRLYTTRLPSGLRAEARFEQPGQEDIGLGDLRLR